jgi:hypothetical protein
MRSQDRRYLTIKPMIHEGHIKTLPDIFVFIPPTIIAKDMGKRGPQFIQLANSPENFMMKEILQLAKLFNITRAEMFQLIDFQLSQRPNDKNPV